jgi:hypothetical protein
LERLSVRDLGLGGLVPGWALIFFGFLRRERDSERKGRGVIDGTIEVEPSLSVQESEVISKNVEKALLEHVRQLGKAVVHVRPKAL